MGAPAVSTSIARLNSYCMSLSWFTQESSSVWYAAAERISPTTRSAFVSREVAACIDRAWDAAGLRAWQASSDVWRPFCAEAAVAQAGGAAPLDEALLAACWRRAVDWAGSPREERPNFAPAFEPLARLPRQLADVIPNLGSQLSLRARPLGELWDARGPGLLRRLESELQRSLPPVSIHWVHPFRGGGGWAEPRLHVVFMEAVLVNPWAPIPEPLRLAWLIAQCAAQLSPEALIPAVLAAGEYVEWTTCDRSHIALAHQAWLGKDDAEHVS